VDCRFVVTWRMSPLWTGSLNWHVAGMPPLCTWLLPTDPPGSIPLLPHDSWGHNAEPELPTCSSRYAGGADQGWGNREWWWWFWSWFRDLEITQWRTVSASKQQQQQQRDPGSMPWLLAAAARQRRWKLKINGWSWACLIGLPLALVLVAYMIYLVYSAYVVAWEFIQT